MTANQQIELRRMGIGWFILKFAEDRGVSIATATYYGKKTAMAARLSAYERTKGDHGAMIKALKTIGLKQSVKAGQPVLDAAQIGNILFKL